MSKVLSNSQKTEQISQQSAFNRMINEQDDKIEIQTVR